MISRNENDDYVKVECKRCDTPLAFYEDTDGKLCVSCMYEEHGIMYDALLHILHHRCCTCSEFSGDCIVKTVDQTLEEIK